MASHVVVLEEEEEESPRKKASPGGARRDVADDDSGELGCCFYILAFFSFLIVIFLFPFSLLCSVKIVKEYERAVILRLGRLVSKKAKGPGIFFILPCIDDVRVVNLRTVTFDVPPQEILTKDSVTCRVDAVVYFRINDPIKSVISVENALNSTYLRAQTTLRNTLGTKKLKDILSERDIIRDEMSRMLDEATDPWGVKVERVEIKDVSLPQDMQRAMAAEAEATREANAKVIAANGERSASEKLRQAADIIDESPASLQLRYLQTLNTISAENNHTYVFPLPIDLLTRLFNK